MKNHKIYRSCKLCPRECRADRRRGEKGVCAVDASLRIARAALHFWEEPCISGTNGSGAVFFSGCALHCVFCQNQPLASGKVGIAISTERLAEIFLELQEQKANNINLVTPGQYIPHIIAAVESARNQGLRIPIVYNTGGYEKVDTIKSLEGIIDIYLPDFKYITKETAERYSHAPDYPRVVKEAIAEMVRQQPRTEFQWESALQKDDPTEALEGAVMTKGVIVRQLLLPGKVKEAQKIAAYLYQHYGNQIYLSMMSQYTPLPHVTQFPELGRKVTHREYEDYINYAIKIGIEKAFVQEGDVAKESFIPDFTSGEGV